jgi:excinuclease UvrABC ATPase subunit
MPRRARCVLRVLQATCDWRRREAGGERRCQAALAGIGITELARLSVTDMRQWVETLQVTGRMSQREIDIARDLVPEIRSRLLFLEKSAWAT